MLKWVATEVNQTTGEKSLAVLSEWGQNGEEIGKNNRQVTE